RPPARDPLPTAPRSCETMDPPVPAMRMATQVPADQALHRIAGDVGERLRAGRHMPATAVRCTGGWVAKVVIDIAGTSAWTACGMAVYSYEAKQAMLGVHPNTLEVHGAVSREAAIEMVSGALVHSGATVAVAVTGIAGPGGGSPDKP